MKDKQPITALPPKTISPRRRLFRWGVFVTILTIIVIFWWRYYKVIDGGIKKGTLISIEKNKSLFKTYEAVISSPCGSTALPEQFGFSIENDSIGQSLLQQKGACIEIHYSQYRNAIWWRGQKSFVGDTLLSVSQAN